jgi:hypothetical protein
MKKSPPTVIGWREWANLPQLGIQAIKAKIDTGARSSTLHAFDVEFFHRQGVPFVRFRIHPLQRSVRPTITAEAPLLEHRWIRSSTGHRTWRPVIRTTVSLMDRRWDIDLTLVNRDEMGFRMLLGREAIRRRFVVDPGRSFFAGKPPGARKKKTSALKRRKGSRP